MKLSTRLDSKMHKGRKIKAVLKNYQIPIDLQCHQTALEEIYLRLSAIGMTHRTINKLKKMKKRKSRDADTPKTSKSSPNSDSIA